MRYSLKDVGLIALICSLLIGISGIYHYHSLSELKEQNHLLLQTLDSKMEKRISSLERSSQDSITALNASLSDADIRIAHEIDSMNASHEASIIFLQRNIDETSRLTQKQLTSLVGAIDDVRTVSEAQISALETNLAKIKTQNADFSGILDKVIASVVSVSTNVGSGTGVIIDSRGYLVTNFHVISGATAASIITSDGKAHATSMVGYDATVDLAVLRIEGAFDALQFGDSDDVDVGERMIAVGNPGGLDFSVTEGIISAKNRPGPNGALYLQHDVPINPGNSGGPLVDASGKIIGINTLKFEGFEGIGFAIPSNRVETFVDQAIAAEEQ